MKPRAYFSLSPIAIDSLHIETFRNCKASEKNYKRNIYPLVLFLSEPFTNGFRKNGKKVAWIGKKIFDDTTCIYTPAMQSLGWKVDVTRSATSSMKRNGWESVAAELAKLNLAWFLKLRCKLTGSILNSNLTPK